VGAGRSIKYIWSATLNQLIAVNAARSTIISRMHKEITMRRILWTLWEQEEGQDLIEYTLLIAFITFATAALFLLGTGGAAQGIWTTANSQLAAANGSAS
jgi:Flp pilus assembly pilin Flp